MSSALWSGLLSLFLTPKHRSSLELCSFLSPLRIICSTGVSSPDLISELHGCISSCMLVIVPCRFRYLRHSCSDLNAWSSSSHFPSSVDCILVYHWLSSVSPQWLFYWSPFTVAADGLLLPVALSTMLITSYPAIESWFTTDFHMSVHSDTSTLFLSQLLLMASSFLLPYLSCSSLLIQLEWSPFPAHCSCLLCVFCITLPISSVVVLNLLVDCWLYR